jgi:putative acetyltransferase
MKLRSYCSSDLEQVMSVYHDAVHVLAAPFYNEEQRAAWAPAISNPDRWRERLSRVRTIVMDAEGVIAGFASYEANGHLDLLFTRPQFARRGVASRLCDSVESSLAQAGVRRLFTEASLAAREFFQSRGFRILHEEKVECRGLKLTRYAMEKQMEIV